MTGLLLAGPRFCWGPSHILLHLDSCSELGSVSQPGVGRGSTLPSGGALPSTCSGNFRQQSWAWPVWLCGQGSGSAWGQDTCPGSVASPRSSLLASLPGEEQGPQRLGEEARLLAPLGAGSSRTKGKTLWPEQGSRAGSSVKMRAARSDRGA